MTQEVITQAPSMTKEQKWASALIASGGDLQLVKEQLNRRLPAGTQPVTESEILQAFIDSANSSKMRDSIKALLLLNYLQILNEMRGHLTAQMPDMSSSELTRTLQMVITGVTTLMAEPVQQTQQTQSPVAIFQQFGADGAAQRIQDRLNTYRELDEKYNAPDTASTQEDEVP